MYSRCGRYAAHARPHPSRCANRRRVKDSRATGSGSIATRARLKPRVGSVSGDLTKLEVAALMGYQWNSILGTEARFIYSRVDTNYKARAIEFGLTIRL